MAFTTVWVLINAVPTLRGLLTKCCIEVVKEQILTGDTAMQVIALWLIACGTDLNGSSIVKDPQVTFLVISTRALTHLLTKFQRH